MKRTTTAHKDKLAARVLHVPVSEMRGQGCEAVALGCTEVPLIITEENLPLPVLDSTRLLASAALRASLG